jgi:hypothetical protein
MHMIGCTGLLAESGIPRTRAGRHRQRTRHAASGLRGGPSTATTPWTKSTATTTGARPLMRPGRFHLAGRMTPHGCRPRAGHLPSIALRAGAATAARSTAKSKSTRRPSARRRPGPAVCSPGRRSASRPPDSEMRHLADRRLVVGPIPPTVLWAVLPDRRRRVISRRATSQSRFWFRRLFPGGRQSLGSILSCIRHGARQLGASSSLRRAARAGGPDSGPSRARGP